MERKNRVIRLLYVPLGRESIERLAQVARAERRTAQEQAAYILEKALQQEAQQCS